jgi:sec-independent protein translocase protein TatA
MFGNLGFGEILVIMLVVLVVFGARRLPEIGASMGKGIREFKRSITEVTDSVSEVPPENRSPGRQIDGAQESTSNTGEPKRLSQ